ncbi:hypothetical protein LOZ66_002024 [Ophidiomyces ophidiicola]|nr:hypothetical protein LOZ66_002024 [Ophidiomyces ophidiicola]
MDLMKNWIRHHVHAALGFYLDDLPDERSFRQTCSKFSGSEMNDHYVRIKINDRQAVQVIKWRDLTSPIEAVLSDSFSSINARFSDDSVARYVREKKAGIRVNTKGALIKITDFDVLVSRKSRSVPVILLYIRHFEVLGCEGTGMFGSPRHVSSYPTISALAKECQITQKNAAPNFLDTSVVHSQQPIVDEDNQATDVPESCSTSQAAFSTQVGQNRGLKVEKQQISFPLNSPTNLSADTLLSLLAPHGSKLTGVVTTPRQTSAAEKFPHSVNTMLPPSIENSCAVTPRERVNSPMDSIKALSSEDEEDSFELCVGKQKSSTNDDSIVQSSSLAAPPNCTSNSLVTKLTNQTLAPATLEPQPTEEAPNDADPWNGWSRISWRDIFIPRDQQELIDNLDSWVPPAAGRSLPPGRVPLALLQEWNDKQIKRKAVKDTVQNKNSCSPKPGAHEKQLASLGSISPLTSSLPPASEFDEDIWPPSPIDDRCVPPDSSPGKSPIPNRGTIRDIRTTQQADDQPYTATHNAQKIFVSQIPRPGFVGMSGIPAAPELTYSDSSDIEYSIPRGLDTSTQENQSGSVPCSGLSPPALRPVSFTQVQRSPDIAIIRTQSRIKTASFSGPECQQHKIAEKRDGPIRSSSDIVVPATFGSVSTTQKSLPANSMQRVTEATTQSSASNDDTSDAFEASQQLVSELGSSIASTGSRLLSTCSVNASLPANSRGMSILPQSSRTDLDLISKERIKRNRDRCYIQSPSAKRRMVDTEADQTHQPLRGNKNPENQIHTVSIRQSFFCRALPSTEVDKIFHKFKQAYSSYGGNFHAFIHSCLKLLSLRSKGFLSKSILWDDFVYQEAAQYQDYIKKCQDQEASPIPYEQYFLKYITVPSLRKRNLTGKSLELILRLSPDIHENSRNHIISRAEITSEESKVDGLLNDSNLEIYQERSPSDSIIIEANGLDKRGGDRPDSVSIPDSEDWHGYETHETASVELGDTDDSMVFQSSQKLSFVNFEQTYMEEEPAGYLGGEETSSHSSSENSRQTLKPTETPAQGSENTIESQIFPPNVSRDKNQYFAVDSGAMLDGLRAQEERPIDEAFFTTELFYPPYRPPKVSTKKKSSSSTTAETSTPTSNRWRDRNTPFKNLARQYVNLHGELGRYRQPGNAEAVPVDENGVILPQSLCNEPVEGRMNSRG